MKPVLFKETLTGDGNVVSNDERILSLWTSHYTDAVSPTQHNKKDRHTLSSTDSLGISAMEMESIDNTSTSRLPNSALSDKKVTSPRTDENFPLNSLSKEL